MGGVHVLLLALRFLRLIAAESLELRGTARLLSTVLAKRFVIRGALLVLGAVVLPLLAVPAGPTKAGLYVLYLPFAAGLALAFAGEILGRYLFFVSVVPRHMAAPYMPAGSEAV